MVVRSHRLVDKQVQDPKISIRLVGGSGYLGSLIHARLLRSGFPVHNRDLIDSPLHSSTGGPAHRFIFLAWPRMSVQERMEDSQEGSVLQRLRDDFEHEMAVGGEGIFISSCQALDPVNRYGHSKLAFENWVMNEYGNRVAVVRLSTMFGLTPATRFDLMLNRMALDGLTTGTVKVQGPTIRRPHLSVSRAANRLIDLATATEFEPGLRPEPFCDFCTTIRKTGTVIADYVGCGIEESAPPRPTREILVNPNGSRSIREDLSNLVLDIRKTVL